ncbi:MAG: DUF58 domain-containing protein [Victivallales bacterium]|nr:DUF58 domain-containing protein [Victivallales bacterium]
MSSFIRPTKRGWLLAVNSLLWYMVARGNQNLITLILSWSSLALIAIGFLMAFFSLRRIFLRRSIVAEAHVAQLVNLPIVCINPLWRKRQPFIICESLPFADTPSLETLVADLESRSSQTISRMVMPVKRGDYPLSEITIQGTDPVGLFIRTRAFQLLSSIVIYPPVFPIHDLALPMPEVFSMSLAQESISAAGDSQDFYGVREYHPSDGMKHIHWKSSAKYGRLMVREYERSAALSVCILIDACESDVTRKSQANFEFIVSMAASVCTCLRLQRCSLSYAAGGNAPVVLESREISAAFSRVMYEIATIRAGEHCLDEAMEILLPSISPHTVVFCFTLSESPHIRTVIDSLQMKGTDIRWYVASPNAFLPPRERRPSADNASSFPKYVTPDIDTEHIFT